MARVPAARVVVIGAGVGGLGCALALSRDGHEVLVLERDATPLPASADEAFSWDRRGAPQVRHSHALLARLRNLLRDRYPDVLEGLFAAGATEIRLMERLPDTIDDRSPRPEDEDLVMLACRRTTFEWVLRRTVLGTEGVTLLDGVVVDGLHVEGGRVTGVHATVGGTPQVLDADIVVAACGARSGVPAWLAQAGVEVQEAVEDTGIIYFSRFYRLLHGADVPEQLGLIGGDLGYLKYGIFQGDNRTFSVTLATRTDDDALRARLLDPATFDLAASVLVATAAWVEPARSEAITSVHVMAKLLNRQRSFLDADGRPTVLGFHAVGDAHTCTNPMYGRGCSLAMVQATLLADALRAHPQDDVARALAFETASEREIAPWYRAAVAQDRQGREEVSGAPRLLSGAPDVLRAGLLPAMRAHAAVLRAFLRTFNLLAPPDAVLSDPEVIGLVLSAFQDRENRPLDPVLGPPRDEMLAALG